MEPALYLIAISRWCWWRAFTFSPKQLALGNAQSEFADGPAITKTSYWQLCFLVWSCLSVVQEYII